MAIRVAINTSHRVFLTRDKHNAFDIAQGGQLNRLAGHAQPPLHQSPFMNVFLAARDFNIKWARAVFAGARDFVFRFDNAIPVGVHIEIEVVAAHFIHDHDDTP